MKTAWDLIYQVLVFLGLNLIIMILVRFFGKSGSEWFVGAFILGIFELTNPIIGIFSKRWWPYTGLSIPAFALLVVFVIFSGALLSKKTMDQFGESAMVYLIVLYYPIIIFICGIIRIFTHSGKN